MGELTRDQLEKYNDEFRCPFCGSDEDLSIDDYDYEASPSRVASCGKCDRTWIEHYEVVAVTFDSEHGDSLPPESWTPERDAKVKDALKAAGRSWCGVPGCVLCWENYTKLQAEIQEFQPGEKALVKAHTVGCYPLAPCTIIKKMVDEAQTCLACGQKWPGFQPHYYRDHPSYLLKYDKTGAHAILGIEKIVKRSGEEGDETGPNS